MEGLLLAGVKNVSPLLVLRGYYYKTIVLTVGKKSKKMYARSHLTLLPFTIAQRHDIK